MPKERHDQPTNSPSKAPLLILTVGVLLVAGLVVWALTRTVEPTRSVAADLPVAAPAVPGVATATTPVPDQVPSSTAPSPVSAPVPATTLPMTTALSTMPSDAESQKAAIPRISAEDLKEKMNAGAVTVVDVRDAAAFASGHIAGALHIPLSSVEANLDLLPKGKDIVTYCT